jgi:hypothetical protein
MLPDIAISEKLRAPDALAQLAKLSLAELVSLSAKCAFALPNLHRAEELALGDVVSRSADAIGADDFLTRAIQADDDLRSIAADLIERASTRTA